MARPWTVLFPRRFEHRGEERTEFLKVGVAFPMREKEGFSLTLYFRLLPGAELVMMPPRDREAAPRAEGTAQASEPPDGWEDDVPF